MKLIRNFFIVLLSILIIILMLFMLFNQTLFTTIFEPYNSTQYFEDSGIYESMEYELENELLSDIEANSNSTNIIINLIINRVIDSLVTDERVEAISDELQIIFWDYITGENDSIGNLSLFEDINKFTNIIKNEADKVDIQDGFFPSTLINEIEIILDSTIPSSVELQNYLEDETMQYLDSARFYYHEIEIIKAYIFALILILFLLIIIFSRNLMKSIKSFSYIFSITAILAFIPIILINVIDKKEIIDELILLDITSTFQTSLLNVLDFAINDITRVSVMYSFIFLAIGLLFLIVYKVLNKITNRAKKNENIE